MDLSKITDVQVDGIDLKDFPDFTDSFFSSAKYEGQEMTNQELEKLNENYEFLHKCIINQIY